MYLQHKSKLLVYSEVKREVVFEEYFEHINGAHSRLLLNCVQIPMEFLKSWVGTQRKVGPRNVLIVGLVRSLLSMSFLSLHHAIPIGKIFLTI